MDIKCRPFLSADYNAFAAINNAIYPRHQTTAEDEEEGDSNRPVGELWTRWAIEDMSGVVVGVAEIRQHGMDPGEFDLEIYVHPERQDQGFGKALYRHLLSELDAWKPSILHADEVKEDLRGVRFLKDRGFTEVMRWWQANLNVSAFDSSPYQNAAQRALSSGIQIQTLQEREAGLQHDQRLYDLICDVSRDLPSPEPYQQLPFETFCAEMSKRKDKDSYFIALQGDLYVGVHILVPSYGDDIRIETTGVRSTHRRQGIALALKLHGIDYTQSQGRSTLRTMNATDNQPIIALNDRLGFVRQAAWLKMVKMF